MNFLSRRDFLKLSALGLSGMVGLSGQQNAVLPYSTLAQAEFSPDARLGRVNVGRIEIKARPEDSKWVLRWSLPPVSYDPGDAVASNPGGTTFEVVES